MRRKTRFIEVAIEKQEPVESLVVRRSAGSGFKVPYELYRRASQAVYEHNAVQECLRDLQRKAGER